MPRKMKTLILSSFFALAALRGFGQNAYPSYFNTSSTNSKCGPLGEIKLVYSNGCPGILPVIDSIYSYGKKCDITLAAPDNSGCTSAYPSIRYCLTSGKIPSGSVYEIYFRNPDNSTFKYSVPCNCAFVVPVTFTSFTVAVSSNTILAKWNTEDEVNNSHFLLERSEDGKNFSTIATVQHNNAGSYQADDIAGTLLGQSVLYYRIKQVDLDGRFSYSNILSVRLNKINSQNTIIAPNPFRESVLVNFVAPANGNAEIRIVNLAGQVTASKRFTASKGNNSHLIDRLSRLNTGIYIIQLVINGTIIQNQKLVKQ